MDDFDKEKQICLSKLYKPDKSRKGDVDEAIISLIDHINSSDNFYTTSSCSGRIMILTCAEKKPDVRWLYVTHEKADAKKILETVSEKNLEELEISDNVWLRQENLILHVACRTLVDAQKLLKIARDLGLRRSGIIADSKIIIVEICSTEKMDVPITDKKNLLVSEKYINFLVDIANQKFLKGRKKLERLHDAIKQMLV